MKNRIKYLNVLYHHAKVGLLVLQDDGKVAFQYDESWLKNGFSISPLSLPLTNGIFVPKSHTFDGLFGVFADSLPDSWGQLLLSRKLQRQGISYQSLNILEKLAFLTSDSLGALTYEPNYGFDNPRDTLDFDAIKKAFDDVQEDNPQDYDALYLLGGSSGGSRPKAHVRISDDDWIVKFPLRTDKQNVGKMEYDYNRAALKAGLIIPSFDLFPSKWNDGYFGEMRFDRNKNERIHVISVSGLLEVSHEYPSLDYLGLMKLTRKIAGMTEVYKVFRVMCFNVFAHNTDDHTKNFSFYYDKNKRNYMFSPSFDLTKGGMGKEHEMTVNKNGNPGLEDIYQVAKAVGLDEAWFKAEAQRIQNVVQDELKEYLS